MNKTAFSPDSTYDDLLLLPLKIAVYHRIPADGEDSLIQLESTRIRQFINKISHWDLCAMFFDTKPGWAGYHKLCASSFDLIFVRSMNVFGDHPSEIYKKVRKLPMPVLFEIEQILSYSEAFFDWYRRSQRSGDEVLTDMFSLKGRKDKYL